MAMRVLVTRPEPGASETTRRLETLGFQPIKLPLQETRPLPVDDSACPEDVAVVVVPSASAVRHAPRGLLDKWAGAPCLAVGEATAQAARAAGFSQVREGGGDAEALAGDIIANKPSGVVGYMCGKVRRPVFEQRLAAAGISVCVVETYDTLPIACDDRAVIEAVGTGSIDYVLVYSANAAELLLDLTTRKTLQNLFASTTWICISARVAELFSGDRNKIVIAQEPNEEALLDALRDAASRVS
ncbi:MAG: uroporphyrinogen-III synthase [Mesorhizobium sp.]|nr:uroporphyrinogen-III synthase [Mesorhizobium sp.]MBL8576641.1 uroporphyrinogen-III synthase [Mesorhizobium sp.]